jgi:hypothetical protein
MGHKFPNNYLQSKFDSGGAKIWYNSLGPKYHHPTTPVSLANQKPHQTPYHLMSLATSNIWL